MKRLVLFTMAKIKEKDIIIDYLKSQPESVCVNMELLQHMSAKSALLEVLEEGAKLLGIED